MRWTARGAFGLVLALGLTGLLTQEASAQADMAAWREGVSLFEQGQYAEALDKLDTFIASAPSSEEALRARNEAGYRLFVQMMARKDDFATIARKVLELAEIGERFDRPDAERIKGLIRTWMSGEYEQAYTAMNELVSQIGPYCVPYLVEYLADRRNDDKRAKAIVLLSRMGPDGTNAVIELLYHDDDYVRENACAILGHIRDLKGIPYLKAMTERKGESSHVASAARKALQEITGKDAGSLQSALVYFAALAERYFQEHPSVMVNNFREWTVWDWRDEKLVWRAVPGYAFNDEMAENVCYDALDHARRAGGGDLDAIHTILVSAHFNEVVEVEHLLEVADAMSAAGRLEDEAAYEELKEARSRLVNLRALAAASGEDQVAKALKKALVDRRVPLAVALIEQLRDMRMSESLLPADGADLSGFLAKEGAAPAGLSVEPRRVIERTAAEPVEPRVEPRAEPQPQPRSEPEPETEPETEEGDEPQPAPGSAPAPRRRRRISQVDPLDAARYAEAFGPTMQHTLQSTGGAHGAALAAALTYDDKRVRYAAAEALLRLAPTKTFAGSDKVAEGLSGALRESSARVILIAAKEQQVRNRLSGIARQMNHLPFAVPTSKQALFRARSAPAHDAILVHTEFREDDFSTAQFIEQIEQDYRTKGIPIIVITPRASLRENQKLFAKAAAVLSDEVDPVDLQNRLEAIWTGDYARPNDPKTKSMLVARKAALAIAESDPRISVFPLDQTVPALLEAIEFQPDPVRIPALRALGVLGASQASSKAAIIFENQRNSAEVREAAAFCLGESLRGKPCPSKVFDAMKRTMQKGDHKLFTACGEALGKMRLSQEQGIDLLQTLRVE